MSAEYRSSSPTLSPVGTTHADTSSSAREVHAVRDPIRGFAALAPLSGASIDRALQSVYQRRVKRLVDVLLSVVLLALLSPVFALAALALFLEEGRPVIFKQRRVGKGGEYFDVIKFRTMIPDRRSNSLDITFEDRRQRHKSKSDPRVTRVGAFLRRTSIDEFPQLVNVLRGDMSLVGPRPELPHLVDKYEEWQHARHLVRPGITGWWQVNGRSNRPMHESTELDIYYVEHISLWLDIRILARTPLTVGKGHGAY